MSFLYPLFLISGIALAIPVLIHLFNLRRYKTVYFPHTRFLKDIQLRSQKQSQVRYRLLLFTRLLFLAALILAFAQPFFQNKEQAATKDKLQVIYIDNSGSMSLKLGAQRLVDVAKQSARRQIQQATVGTRFVLLTNDRMVGQPLPADKALLELNNIDLSPKGKTMVQVLSGVQSSMQAEGASGADLYYYSDFQERNVSDEPEQSLTDNISLHGVPVQTDKVENVFIDTAYLMAPVLQTGTPNQLVVHTRTVGSLPDEMPVMQLFINGQLKNAASLVHDDRMESWDTLSFQVEDAGWQQIELSINDAAVRFDDTFRIAARSASNLSVLALNQGSANPYIQAAFRAYDGFRLTNSDLGNTSGDWNNYNLILLNNVTAINSTLAEKLQQALSRGKTVAIFPGRTNSFGGLNSGLAALGDIRITGLDTATQAATNMQQGSDLVKDLFVSIPDNIELPQANWHYRISAGLTANQQSILSFRNGDPLFARYTPTRGQLYLLATSADMQAGNFAASYFFVPFLYQMATQATGSNIYALTLGAQTPAFLPLDNAGERNMIHLYAPGRDVIPAQQTAGAGLNVYVDQAVTNTGYYRLAAEGGDTTLIAVNSDHAESQLQTYPLDELKNSWKDKDAEWLTTDTISMGKANNTFASFPLWKVCAILALLMLIAETIVLAGGFKKQSAAT